MRSRELSSGSAGRAFALVFATGDEVMTGLHAFARGQHLSAARFTAIGAFQSVVLGYFAWDRKDYERIPLDEQVEVLMLAGDVALADDAPAIHAHVVVGRRDGSTRGGHLLEGHVRPTLELMLEEAPAELRKRHDPATGLSLIDLER